MKVICIYSTNYRSNTFLACSDGHCAIIDPGAEVGDVVAALEKNGLIPDLILLTHGHFDHIFSLDSLRERFSVPVYIHADDAELLTSSEKNAYSLFWNGSFTQGAADKTFIGGDRIAVGSEFLDVIHTPGHTNGSSCFACGDILITGDTLFADSFGRTDLYGGDSSALFKSLSAMRNLKFSAETKIYPGHGGSTLLSYALDNVIY